MKGYKFLDSQHVDGMLQGRVRFATLDYFRQMEGPQWIADSSEGTQNTNLRDFTFQADHTDAEKHRRKLASLGIRIGNATGVSFIDTIAETIAMPLYVFCFSIDPFDAARKAMCEDAPEDARKDACVEISDVESFCKWVCNGRFENQQLSTFMDEMAFDVVTYDKREHDFDEDDEFEINPFAKHDIFKYQQEYRIVLVPKVPLPDFLFVDFLVPPGMLNRKPI